MAATLRRAAMALLATLLGALAAIAEPRPITFDDLPDASARIYEDPFRDMGSERLRELRSLVQLEAELGRADIPADVRAELEGRRRAALASLEGSGTDAEEILSQRWVVAERRERAARAVNPALAGAEVTLDGYLVRIQRQDRAPVAYLVPVIGMCSHTPPPPPNELVRVDLSGMETDGRVHLPVRLTGTLRAVPSDETLFMLDGPKRMISEWTLVADDLVVARRAPGPEMPSAMARALARRGEIGVAR